MYVSEARKLTYNTSGASLAAIAISVWVSHADSWTLMPANGRGSIFGNLSLNALITARSAWDNGLTSSGSAMTWTLMISGFRCSARHGRQTVAARIKRANRYRLVVM